MFEMFRRARNHGKNLPKSGQTSFSSVAQLFRLILIIRKDSLRCEERINFALYRVMFGCDAVLAAVSAKWPINHQHCEYIIKIK